MEQRTLFFLLVAAALAAPVACAQDATQAAAAQPSPTRIDASMQQSTAAEAGAATADQGKTSGDASGMAANASTASTYEAAATAGEDQAQGHDHQDQDDPPQQP